MQRPTLSLLIPALGLAVAVGCAGGSSTPTPGLAWNQATVTQIARQLSAAADAWHLAVRQQNDEQLGSGSAQEGLKLTQRAQVVSEQARSLADHLEAGEGRDQTLDPFQSLKEVMDDSQEAQERSELDQPTIVAWAKLTGLMHQIKPYYEK